MENNFINHFNLVNTLCWFSAQNGTSEWWEHILIALFGDGILDANAINHLSLSRDYGWSWWLLNLGLLPIEDVEQGPLVTLIGNVVFSVSQWILKLPERKVVEEIGGLPLFSGPCVVWWEASLNSVEVLDAVGEPLWNALDLHWLIGLLIAFSGALPRRHVHILEQRPRDRLKLITLLLV